MAEPAEEPTEERNFFVENVEKRAEFEKAKADEAVQRARKLAQGRHGEQDFGLPGEVIASVDRTSWTGEDRVAHAEEQRLAAQEYDRIKAEEADEQRKRAVRQRMEGFLHRRRQAYMDATGTSPSPEQLRRWEGEFADKEEIRYLEERRQKYARVEDVAGGGGAGDRPQGEDIIGGTS